MCCATKRPLLLKGVLVAKDVAGAVSLKTKLADNHDLDWKPPQPLQISEVLLYATRRPGHEPSKCWILYLMEEIHVLCTKQLDMAWYRQFSGADV
jgi:hypothetical protein